MLKSLLAACVLLVASTLAPPALAEEQGPFLQQFQGYLAIAEKFTALASQEEAAVFFAIEGIVEIHEQRDSLAEAIPLLAGFLDDYPDNRAIRNVIRFKLRDLYRETGQPDEALAQMIAVVEENR